MHPDINRSKENVNMSTKLIECKICNKKFKTLYTHLRVHNIKAKEYLEKFPGEPLSIDKSLLGMWSRNSIPWNKGATGGIAWNTGLTKETDDRVKRYAEKLKISMVGKIPWCAGLTKLDHPSLMKLSKMRMGDKNPIHTPGTKERVSKSLKRFYKNNPDALKNRKWPVVNQYSKKYTKIEKIIADTLREYNIEFIHNPKILTYWPDFLILDNVLIECDGKYWHKNYNSNEEKRENELKNAGYKIFRLQEEDILDNPKKCIEKIIY